mmetsp:Transcript_10461/g.30760  ORF Transcript_10461/g.30760 Transcript_10461/m.30760 type:complete len:255 (-) Transcript_10461:672-1436(-)
MIDDLGRRAPPPLDGVGVPSLGDEFVGIVDEGRIVPDRIAAQRDDRSLGKTDAVNVHPVPGAHRFEHGVRADGGDPMTLPDDGAKVRRGGPIEDGGVEAPSFSLVVVPISRGVQAGAQLLVKLVLHTRIERQVQHVPGQRGRGGIDGREQSGEDQLLHLPHRNAVLIPLLRRLTIDRPREVRRGLIRVELPLPLESKEFLHLLPADVPRRLVPTSHGTVPFRLESHDLPDQYLERMTELFEGRGHTGRRRVDEF